MPVAPITAQDPLAPQKLSHPQQKHSTKKKNQLEREEHICFPFYAVKRGLQNKQLHTLWDTTKQEVLDPLTQNF
eukprot:12668183-Ditylum_brightwellii.AAC.1